MKINRRRFNQYLVALAFSGLSKQLYAAPTRQASLLSNLKFGYGDLISDPKGILDLPVGFSYRIISTLNDKMDDGLGVPDRADGMGCFYHDDDKCMIFFIV